MQCQDSELPRAQRRGPARPLSHFVALNLPRDVAMAQAFTTGAYSQAEIARVFGVHYATVSRAVARQAAPDAMDAAAKRVSRAAE